jgi:preprotein translocase subunit YajC
LFTDLVHAFGSMGGEGDGGSGILGMLLPFVIIIAVFYFLIILPQRRKEKKKQAMLEALVKGDRVVTIGGLRGTVVGVDDRTDVVTVRVSGDVKLEFLRNAIASVEPKYREGEEVVGE